MPSPSAASKLNDDLSTPPESPENGESHSPGPSDSENEGLLNPGASDSENLNGPSNSLNVDSGSNSKSTS